MLSLNHDPLDFNDKQEVIFNECDYLFQFFDACQMQIFIEFCSLVYFGCCPKF